MRLGECPGRARGLMDQGYLIEMTRLPVTFIPAFAGMTNEVERVGNDA